ncbi:HesA/MoeB/ThiF family protein [Acidianus sulfidivorans]|nr:HesA/MoeB/ThiF family protein [Acidianus sulfidivorans]
MERFSRQLLTLGIEVQQKIMESKVLVAGCGALGSALAEFLVRLGVKEITIVDADIVELSNLHRTHIFTEKDLMKPKVIACKNYLSKINSNTKINAIEDIIDNTNADEIVKNHDIVFDGLDNIYYRLILNDACVKNNIPLIYAGISGEYGSAKLVIPNKTACLSCFLQPYDTQDSCNIIGTSTIVPAVMASIQIQLFINYLRGEINDNLILFDLKNLSIDKVPINRNPSCEACSYHEYKYLNEKPAMSCGLIRYYNKNSKEKLVFSSDEIQVFKDEEGYILCYNQKCYKKKTA